MGSDEGEASLKESQSGGSTLFGVELNAPEGAAFHGDGDAFGSGGAIGARSGVRVGKVIRLAPGFDPRPPQSRYATLGHQVHRSGQQSESVDAAVFITVLEGQLHAETDSE